MLFTHRLSGLSRPERPELRILFCGSDAFSIASLVALHEYANLRESSIASIDVVTKTDKLTGRGLKHLTSPPIKRTALYRELPLHQIDTFTGWSPPNLFPDPPNGSHGINLVIAVSFGLLVPPRILRSCQYGGLNVHPSLLPDLPGAAPIQWAILNGYQKTGISVQTLHPSKFDGGTVLSQKEVLIDDWQSCSDETLGQQLAPVGAHMLVDAIKDGLYLTEAVPSRKALQSGALVSLAPRITTKMAQVDFQGQDGEMILRMSRVMPRLWAEVPLGPEKANRRVHETKNVRLVLGNGIGRVESALPQEVQDYIGNLPPGLPFAVRPSSREMDNTGALLYDSLYVKAADGDLLVINYMTVEGRPVEGAFTAAVKTGLFLDLVNMAGNDIFVFHQKLCPTQNEATQVVS